MTVSATHDEVKAAFRFDGATVEKRGNKWIATVPHAVYTATTLDGLSQRHSEQALGDFGRLASENLLADCIGEIEISRRYNCDTDRYEFVVWRRAASNSQQDHSTPAAGAAKREE